VVAAPLKVLGVIVPQLDVLDQLQLSDHVTPAPAESLPTIAVRLTVCAKPEIVSTYKLVGKTLTVTGTGAGGAVIVSVMLADLLVSVSEVAVSVTTLPGTAAGAV
jgi:hypothetical protein